MSLDKLLLYFHWLQDHVQIVERTRALFLHVRQLRVQVLDGRQVEGDLFPRTSFVSSDAGLSAGGVHGPLFVARGR